MVRIPRGLKSKARDLYSQHKYGGLHSNWTTQESAEEHAKKLREEGVKATVRKRTTSTILGDTKEVWGVFTKH